MRQCALLGFSHHETVNVLPLHRARWSAPAHRTSLGGVQRRDATQTGAVRHEHRVAIGFHDRFECRRRPPGRGTASRNCAVRAVGTGRVLPEVGRIGEGRLHGQLPGRGPAGCRVDLVLIAACDTRLTRGGRAQRVSTCLLRAQIRNRFYLASALRVRGRTRCGVYPDIQTHGCPSVFPGWPLSLQTCEVSEPRWPRQGGGGE